MKGETTMADYNGWTNYETWVVNLWMQNDETSSAQYRQLAQEIYEQSEANSINTREEEARYSLAEALKADFDENTPETEGVFADLLNSALSEVNWYEIAEHLLEQVAEDSAAA